MIGLALVALFMISSSDSEKITNGRLGLWIEIFNRAGQSFLFGNGIEAFNAINRSDYGFSAWAGQGHNQFADSFFTGGVLALAPLLVLVVVCTAWVVRPGPQRRIAVAAFAVLLGDMTVESPLRQALSSPALMAVIVLAIVTAHGGRHRGVIPPRKPPPIRGFAS
jgi:O-antigen ligase